MTMINGIIKAMSVALNTEFNASADAYEIYDKEIPQDLVEPAFYIQAINPSTSLFLGKRYLKRNYMVVQYFPVSKTDYQEECNSIAERLLWCLEWITCSGDTRPIRGSNMHYEVVDGVLNFFVDYEFFIRKVEEVDEMALLEIKQTAN